MSNEHPISDEVLDIANIALSKGEHWMTYNKSLYFIDKNDVCFFRNETDANEFANDNISDKDFFNVIRFDSILDILKRIPYGYELSKQLEKKLSNSKSTQSSLFSLQLKTNVMNNEDSKELKQMSYDDIRIKHESDILSLFKNNTMNQENFQYLSDNIKYMGFGENLKADLGKNMNEGRAEFQLHYKAEINKKSFEATLNFRKSDSTDMYFFNTYHASLEKSNGEKMDQTFYLNKGKGITSKEAFNLLDGRAVQKDLVTKEGQPYKAWIQLDPGNKDKNNNFEVKQFHENYGFDLKTAVGKFPIMDLKDPEKEKALMQSLQKGNVQSVSIEKYGNSHKMFIEADPQYKKVNLFDLNMNLVAKESLEQYKTGIDKGTNAVKEDVGEDKKKDFKQVVKPEKDKLEKKNDKTLLPKKRQRAKKGLGLS